jgi:hypothetical protein
MLEAKKRMPDTTQFSLWIERNGLQKINNDKRAALLGMARDLTAARLMLEKSSSSSWDLIWRNRPQTRLRSVPNSQPQPNRGRSKHNRIPDVMRDDAPTQAPPSRKPPPTLKVLTPEQVDPDFKGTPLDFSTKYGHVNLYTKQQIEQTKRQDALMEWLGMVADLDRIGRGMLSALAKVDHAAIDEWMGKNGKRDKFQAWSKSVQLASDAICKLCGKITHE